MPLAKDSATLASTTFSTSADFALGPSTGDSVNNIHRNQASILSEVSGGKEVLQRSPALTSTTPDNEAPTLNFG